MTKYPKLTKEEIQNHVPVELQETNYLEIGERPWGFYYVLEDKPTFKVKKIIVNPNSRLSLQSHKHRSEHWVVVSGQATVEIRNKSNKDQPEQWVNTMNPNESCYIPLTATHRLSNEGVIPLVIIEVQVGEYTGEDDIIRFEDDFDRK